MYSLKCPCCGTEVVPGESIPVSMKYNPKNIICISCENELMIDKKSNYTRFIIGGLALIGVPLVGNYFGFSPIAAFLGMGLIVLLVILTAISHRRLKIVPVNDCK